MPIVPTKDTEAITFFEAHIPVWTSSPTSIGLTALLVSGFDTQVKAARAKLTSAIGAREASKTATNALNTSVGTMREVGADLIATIKAFADTTNNPAVYDLAQIPPPAAPTPPPALTAPENLVADPSADGTISLSWKGSIKYSTFFSIFRKGPGETGFTQIATVASKQFVDPAPPPPTATARVVEYLVRAQRQTAIGPPSSIVTVTYGAGGQMFTSVRLVA
jgi:hypothetical protein